MPPRSRQRSRRSGRSGRSRLTRRVKKSKRTKTKSRGRSRKSRSTGGCWLSDLFKSKSKNYTTEMWPPMGIAY